MKHWIKKYPHKVYASVVLLDGKIYNWKVGQSCWNSAYEAKVRFSDFDKLDKMIVRHTYWVVYSPEEHQKVFEKHAKEWFKKWQIHEDHVGEKPY